MWLNNVLDKEMSRQSQCAKKVVSDSPGLVDFCIVLVHSVDNLPDGQVKFWGKFKLQNCNQSDPAGQ